VEARKIVIQTTYTVVGGTEEDAQKACCMIAAGITDHGESLVGPWIVGSVAVEPNISQIVKCEDAPFCSGQLETAGRYIQERKQ